MSEIFANNYNEKIIKPIGTFPDEYDDTRYHLNKALVSNLFFKEIIPYKHSLTKLDTLLLTPLNIIKYFLKHIMIYCTVIQLSWISKKYII